MLSIDYLTFHQEVMAVDIPVLLFCSLHQDELSQKVSKVVDKLELEYNARLKFTKLRIEDFPKLAERLDAKPGELIIYGNGKEFARINGAEPHFIITEKIDYALERVYASLMSKPNKKKEMP